MYKENFKNLLTKVLNHFGLKELEISYILLKSCKYLRTFCLEAFEVLKKIHYVKYIMQLEISNGI